MNKKILAILASYGRSVLASVLALLLAGVTDPVKLLAALVAAVIPVAIRFVNPNDTAFGRVPTVAEVDSALKTANPESDTAKVIENFVTGKSN